MPATSEVSEMVMMTKTTINWSEVLGRFVAKESHRYPGLVKPWKLKDGRLTATDGKAAIVLSAGVAEAEEPTERVADIETVLAIKTTTQPVPMVELPALKRDPCTLCKGKKKGHKCSECNGTGEHYCECYRCSEELCSNCNGTGFVRVLKGVGNFDCPECEGHGEKIDMQQKVEILGSKFRLFDMHRFDGIPIRGIQMAGKDLLRLSFDDGVGMVATQPA